jgi:hypothetical protein
MPCYKCVCVCVRARVCVCVYVCVCPLVIQDLNDEQGLSCRSKLIKIIGLLIISSTSY